MISGYRIKFKGNMDEVIMIYKLNNVVNGLWIEENGFELFIYILWI